MSVSDNFEISSDMQEALAARRKGDEALLTGWVSKLPALDRLFNNLDGLSADGFTFALTSAFEPAHDASTGTYAEPALVKTITFIAGENTSTASVKLNVSGAYSFTSEGNTFEGNIRTQLLQAVEQWVDGLNSEHADLNIVGHIKRADTTPAHKNAKGEAVKSTPKSA